MKRISFVSLALATALAAAPVAMADTFDFTVTGVAPGDTDGTSGLGIVNASGSISGSEIGVTGNYNITSASASITINGTTYFTSGSGIITNPVPGVGNTTNPLAAFDYSDAFNPTGSPTEILNLLAPNNSYAGGILFDVGGGEQVDIWYVPAAGANPGGYTLAWYDGSGNFNSFDYDPSNVADGYDVTFNAVPAPTPEPSSLLLMGTGLLLMAGFLFRQKALQGVL